MTEKLDPDSARFLTKQFKYGGERALGRALELERGVSRQSATTQLKRWVQTGILEGVEQTRPKRYTLKKLIDVQHRFELAGFDEHVVWYDTLRPTIAQYASPAALSIWDYGATEMLNNAKDHSQGSAVVARITITAAYANLLIEDDGEGIFKRIARLCGLADERFSILELSKGKLTTAPEAHSGEGIFFTSRAFDRFQIRSGDLIFDHTELEKDHLFDLDEDYPGTSVLLRLCHETDRNLRSIFDAYTIDEAEDGVSKFNKTVIPVRLVKFGNESVVSRSQAQRLLARFDRFNTIVLDFDGIETIGQGFADEVFRVFQKRHPEIKILFSNAGDDVTFMINRARA